MDEYTPTTDQIRDAYATDPEYEYHNPIDAPMMERSNRRAFDRWLAAHDAVLEAELQTTKDALETARDVIFDMDRVASLDNGIWQNREGVSWDRALRVIREKAAAYRSGVTPDKEGNTK